MVVIDVQKHTVFQLDRLNDVNNLVIKSSEPSSAASEHTFEKTKGQQWRQYIPKTAIWGKNSKSIM